MKTTAIAAALLGAWSMAVPYAGQALGLSVDVAPEIEVVDHVVPGFLTAVSGAVALGLLRRRAEQSGLYLVSVGFVALAGLWMTATHVPLIGQAADTIVPWDSALWHSLPGFAVLGFGGALLARVWSSGAPEGSGRPAR